MSHFVNAKQQAQSSIQSVTLWLQSVLLHLAPAISSAKASVVGGASYINAVLNRYPPLKALVAAAALFCALPLAVFLGFAAVTSSVVLGVAGVGVALVEGTLLSVAGFVLFWFVVGALFFAGFTAFWFSVAYFGLRVVKKVE
eukprot:jgi/Hompol1/626/HPOL_005374-RA